MKDILLINPPIADGSTTPFYVMPVGLLSVISYLKEKGKNTSFLDLNITKKALIDDRNNKDLFSEIENQLRLDEPALIGLSVMVAGQFRLVRDISEYIKQVMPNIKIALGGSHVSQFPEDILINCPFIDFIVIGEGEIQLLALIEYIKKGKFPDDALNGIAYRSDNKIVTIPKKSFIDNINSLPSPAYDIVNFSDYYHDTTSWHNPYKIDFGVRVPIITSRGCPNMCNFCSLPQCMGHKFRPMDANKVVDLMQSLHEKYGSIYFAIFDANFTEDYIRVIKICEEINKRNLKIYLDLPTGMPINANTPAMIDALAEAGLLRTCISIESGDSIIRNKYMLKKVDQDEIFKVVNTLRKYPQIFLLTDFVIGMPEETIESLDSSLSIIKDLDVDDITLSIATPYPGTKLYEQCLRDNLFFFDIDKTQLWQSSWYNHADIKKFIIKPYNLNIEILQKYRNKILAFRDEKIFAYEKRMEKYFNEYGKRYSSNIYLNQKIDNYANK